MADQKFLAPERTERPFMSWRARLDNVFFQFSLRWNDRAKDWQLAIGTSEGTILIQGLRVVIGVDLIAPFVGEQWPAGQILAEDVEGLDRDPDRHAWRQTHRLVYRPAEDVAALAGTSREVR